MSDILSDLYILLFLCRVLLLFVCFSRQVMWLNRNFIVSLMVGSPDNSVEFFQLYLVSLECAPTCIIYSSTRDLGSLYVELGSPTLVLCILRFLSSLSSFDGHSELRLLVLQVTKTVSGCVRWPNGQVCPSLPKFMLMELAMAGVVFTL